MSSPHALWTKILAEIETSVSRANFLTLFKGTLLLSLEENVATVAAPSSMIIDLIQRRFFQLLKKTLDRNVGKDVQIVFVPKTIVGEKEERNGPLFAEDKEQTKPFVGHLPRVRPDFTFQNMAVSSSNQLAYISAQTVANNIGGTYNPLFIYGPVGVGKTHLMQAIANHVYLKTPNRNIIYITSEEFTNEVVEAIRTNQTHAMKKRFRTVELLIIDDVQFIAGKERVQEELFHTFNILIDKNAQVVLSSDRPASEIKKLEVRLSSRFLGGLTVDIETPDFELRCAIILIKASKYNFPLPIDIAKIIAEKVQDTRNLEGILLRIITEVQTNSEELSVDLALKVLGRKEEGVQQHLHGEDVIKSVCLFYGLKPTQLKGPRRDTPLVRARHIAMYLLKKELGLSFVEIGNLIGGRDHTTIMHGVGKIESLLSLKNDKWVGEDIVGIRKSLHR